MNAPIASAIGSSAASSTQPSPIAQAMSLPVPRPAQSKTGSTDTDAYLKDFTLLAEAAKRAQVAVMVRDFENCAL
ncbi:hypothetical protein B0I35DRAFT_122772 [Stachybotrys elegans]|uniref:Uncharacterized protein n=1 Tax=Stachybotrys elegans TaxID=80388 RepID=A0A8K0SYX8_9HYPO|nr:hypothetical protein B0I35DRAFT_122772 [Stachybotrys elegans]